MIESDMRDYPLYSLSEDADEYGQRGTVQPSGTIRAAVYVNDRRLTDNAYYSEATLVALTWRRDITDRHLIRTGEGLKKVTMVLPGRMTRLLLTDWGTGRED